MVGFTEEVSVETADVSETCVVSAETAVAEYGCVTADVTVSEFPELFLSLHEQRTNRQAAARIARILNQAPPSFLYYTTFMPKLQSGLPKNIRFLRKKQKNADRS